MPSPALPAQPERCCTGLYKLSPSRRRIDYGSGILRAVACKVEEEPQAEVCTGEERWADEAGGEESESEVVGGLCNVSGMGEELGERSGAGQSHPASRVGHARMTGVCLADSDRLIVRIWMGPVACVCNMCPSWVELLSDGGDAMQRGVHTGVSPTRSQLEWVPGSVQEGSRVGEGWTGVESGSRLGSWNGQTAAGAGGEVVRGREVALGGPRMAADREHSSARVPHRGGNHVLRA